MKISHLGCQILLMPIQVNHVYFLCAYMSVLPTAFPVMHNVYTHAHKCKSGAGCRIDIALLTWHRHILSTYLWPEPSQQPTCHVSHTGGVVSHASALAFLRVKPGYTPQAGYMTACPSPSRLLGKSYNGAPLLWEIEGFNPSHFRLDITSYKWRDPYSNP